MTEKELRQRIEWCEYALRYGKFPNESLQAGYGWIGDIDRREVFKFLSFVQSELIDLLDARLRQSDEEKRLRDSILCDENASWERLNKPIFQGQLLNKYRALCEAIHEREKQ